jgi:hypothetical protein
MGPLSLTHTHTYTYTMSCIASMAAPVLAAGTPLATPPAAGTSWRERESESELASEYLTCMCLCMYVCDCASE